MSAKQEQQNKQEQQDKPDRRDAETRWWWVRHAPVPNPDNLIYGARDVDCDCSDSAAFHALASMLPQDPLLVTSDLRRTRQTAAAIADAGLALPTALVEPAFNEQDFGAWQGQCHDALRRHDPAACHHFWLCPAWHRPPGGESFADLLARIAPAISTLSEAHAGRDILAVAHYGTICAALALALGLDPERALSFRIGNLALTRLDLIADGPRRVWRVGAVNRAPRS